MGKRDASSEGARILQQLRSMKNRNFTGAIAKDGVMRVNLDGSNLETLIETGTR